MFLLSASEMRRLDQLSIRRDQIPAKRLMENAGRAVFRVIQRKYHFLKRKPVFIFCGPGNNGGDGLVVARLLRRSGWQVKIWEKGRRGEGETGRKGENQPGIVIDALFGTGLSRPPKGIFRKALEAANRLKCVKVAVDIPSGLSADTGRPLGISFRADVTVTFGFPKRGFFLDGAADYLGELHVADIGLSQKAIASLNPPVHLITKKDIESLLTSRPKNAHKGSFGHVFTVAGSETKMGAALMASHTALKAGAGLSTLVLPAGAFRHIDMSRPEIMYEPVGDSKRGFFGPKDANKVLSLIHNASIVALGPGIGTKPETIRLVRRLVSDYQGPLIVDADGLNALAKNPALLRKRKNLTLLTPHPGEMARLIRRRTSYVQTHRLEVAKNFSRKYGVVVLLKGYRSVIAFPKGSIWINPTGNSAMASAGQGDVLTGIYAGLLSQYPCDGKRAQPRQGAPLGQAAPLLFGCFLHGLVGDLLAKRGQRVILATDIAKNLSLGYAFLKRKSPVLSTIFY